MINDFFLDGTCMERFYNSSPYKNETRQGFVCSVVKRVLIGLTLAAGLAAGYYFASMAINKVFNPFHLTGNTQMKIYSCVAAVIGASGLILTGLSLFRAHQLYDKERIFKMFMDSTTDSSFLG